MAFRPRQNGYEAMWPSWKFARLATMVILNLVGVDLLAPYSLAATSKTSDALDAAVATLVDDTFKSRPCIANTRTSIGLWTFDGRLSMPGTTPAASKASEVLLVAASE